MKVCKRCKEEKPVSDFWFKDKTTGKRQALCKPCTLEYQKEHYDKSAKRRADIRRANRGLSLRNKKVVREYLECHPCVDCGEDDPIVLDFDHRDRALKEETVSKMAKSHAVERIMEEIQKCDVRCANCHRRRTAKQLGWWIG